MTCNYLLALHHTPKIHHVLVIRGYICTILNLVFVILFDRLDFALPLESTKIDIPAQARELYRVNKVRILYDRDMPTARIMCLSQEELQTPLDMTHCHLRAMSPIHIKYLANMGVVSLSSLVFFCTHFRSLTLLFPLLYIDLIILAKLV